MRQNPQIGHCIADLGPLIEPGAADQAIGQAQGQKALLELAGLERGPDQDRHFVQDLFLALQVLDLFAYRSGLFRAVPQAAHLDLFTAVLLRPQGLA